MPYARLDAKGLPAKFWWWGGVSWCGKLEGPLTVEVEDAPPAEAPGGLTDFFRTTNVRLVSAQMRALLESYESELEFWPVRLTYQGTQQSVEYYAVNALRRVKALDLERSIVELDTETGTAITADRVAIAEDALGKGHWTVVQEINRVAVSDRLREALLQSSFRGFRFVPPSEVRF